MDLSGSVCLCWTLCVEPVCQVLLTIRDDSGRTLGLILCDVIVGYGSYSIVVCSPRALARRSWPAMPKEAARVQLTRQQALDLEDMMIRAYCSFDFQQRLHIAWDQADLPNPTVNKRPHEPRSLCKNQTKLAG